jgi:hypothetical protein
MAFFPSFFRLQTAFGGRSAAPFAKNRGRSDFIPWGQVVFSADALEEYKTCAQLCEGISSAGNPLMRCHNPFARFGLTVRRRKSGAAHRRHRALNIVPPSRSRLAIRLDVSTSSGISFQPRIERFAFTN